MHENLIFVQRLLETCHCCQAVLGQRDVDPSKGVKKSRPHGEAITCHIDLHYQSSEVLMTLVF